MTAAEFLTQNSTTSNVSALTHLQNIHMQSLVTDKILIDSYKIEVIEEEDICMTSFENDIYITEEITQLQEEY